MQKYFKMENISNLYQHYIISIIEQQKLTLNIELLAPNLNNFLTMLQNTPINNIHPTVLFLAQSLLSGTPTKLVIVLFLSDILLFLGIIILVIQISWYYNKYSKNDLFLLVSKTSKYFLGFILVLITLQ
jgi:hypothetical protein